MYVCMYVYIYIYVCMAVACGGLQVKFFPQMCESAVEAIVSSCCMQRVLFCRHQVVAAFSKHLLEGFAEGTSKFPTPTLAVEYRPE